MRTLHHESGALTIWLSANDTYDWAHKLGSAWPCSTLSGNPVVASFGANGDLEDMVVNGGRGDQDIDGTEFNACMSDYIARKYPDHPAIQ